MFVTARNLFIGFLLFVCSCAANLASVAPSIGQKSTTETPSYIELQKKGVNQRNADARNNLRIMYAEGERRKQSKAKTISRNKNISITSNLNDEVIGQLAKEKFGGDTYSAVQWIVSHPKEYRKYVSGYIKRAQR